jgi:hypothetical protein
VLQTAYDAWFSGVFADWQASWATIVAHDRSYWSTRQPPDPAELFRDFWLWDEVAANPAADNPLDVFTGFWNYQERRNQ